MSCNAYTMARAATLPGASEPAARTAHPLFERYPLDGKARISTGTVPTPYHIYDGSGLLIGGTADLEAIRWLLAPEYVEPLQTTDGRALMAIWACAFTNASLGPHHELQFSVFVSPRKVRPAASHRWSLIDVMTCRPDVQMLCHGLWNNTRNVVAYNRELLALNARMARSHIERDAEGIHFTFEDQATGRLILEGAFDKPERTSLSAKLGLTYRLGMRRLSALASEPWLRMQIVNPVGPTLRRNAIADSFNKNAVNVLRPYDLVHNRLVFGETRYRHLGFQPQFVQYMEGFKFVYLFPK